ncbi:MAG: hypothetical protein Q9191_005070 [Dirinaria sp. TL-2023a]
MQLAKDAGVEVVVKVGRTLYDPNELVKANGGKPTMSITQVEHAAQKLPDVPRPIPTPSSLPNPGDTSLDISQDRPVSEPDINRTQRSGAETSYNHLSGPGSDFAVPEYSELGLKPATTPHRGGETAALKSLELIISDESYTATFSKPSTAPTAFSPQSTTLLSPHHHFGSLSVRLLYWRVHDTMKAYEKKGKKASTVPTNLLGQLLFREMYFGAQAALGYSFAQTTGNSHCRFVPWHLPSTVSGGLITGSYTVSSPLHERWLQRWKFGRTGFPWIDALMRQLRQEGWIHHLGRHAVACFLTRGGCYIDWERGAEVFEEWLIDHETACNVGNWQWLACVAFYAQFYRCYSPVAFPKKWDKQGAFVRRYVPELARFPEKYIYEPWKAPIADQKKAGCLVRGEGDEDGENGVQLYPKPMFEFNERRGICIEGLKNAYHVELYGNDERVRNGSWRSLFEDRVEGPTEGNEGITEGPVKDGVSGDVDGDMFDARDEEEVEQGAKVRKNGVDKKDMGVDEDEDEAREVGGETKGGDEGKGKRKRGQGTLDGMFEGKGTKKKGKR